MAIGLSPVEFIAGDCFYCVDPVRLRFKVVFDKAGKASGLRVRESGKEAFAPRLDLYREERVTFTNRAGAQPAGSLFLPSGPGPHPAVVIGHGSGAQSPTVFTPGSASWPTPTPAGASRCSPMISRASAIYAQWGDLTKTLSWLDVALRLRDPGLVNLKTDPLVDLLRQEPRFKAALRELNFPD